MIGREGRYFCPIAASAGKNGAAELKLPGVASHTKRMVKGLEAASACLTASFAAWKRKKAAGCQWWFEHCMSITLDSLFLEGASSPF